VYVEKTNADQAAEDRVLLTVKTYVIRGSMAINEGVDGKRLRVSAKMGDPISDHIRKLQGEFGQQKIDPFPTRAEAEAMLKQQLAEAEKQGRILQASSPRRDGPGWLATWGPVGFGVTALVAAGLVLWQRRRV
jgi:hypothetical protein